MEMEQEIVLWEDPAHNLMHGVKMTNSATPIFRHLPCTFILKSVFIIDINLLFYNTTTEF